LYSLAAMLVGLAIGSGATHYLHQQIENKSDSEVSTPRNSGSTQHTNQDLNNVVRTSVGDSALSLDVNSVDTPFDPSVSENGYRQLLQSLLEIDNASASTIHSIGQYQLEQHSIANSAENQVLTSAVFQRWAEMDVHAAIVLIEETLLPSLSSSATHPQLNAALNALVKVQPAQTDEWLAQLDENQFTSLRLVMLDNLAADDIEQALLEVNDSEKPWASAQYADKLAASDPIEAYDWALNITHERSREAALSAVLEQWAKSDISELSHHITSEPDLAIQNQMYNQVGDRIVSHLSEQDPQLAMNWVDEQPTHVQYKLRESAFDIWIETQPELALDWLRIQPESFETQSLHAMALPYVVEQDIDVALSVFPSLNRNAQIDMAARMVNELSYQRPSDTQYWIESITDPSVRAAAESANQDLALLSQSEALIAELDFKTGAQRANHLRTIMRVLSAGDPDRFSQWLESDKLSDEDHWILSAGAVKGKCG